jgi:hypothetical protein
VFKRIKSGMKVPREALFLPCCALPGMIERLVPLVFDGVTGAGDGRRRLDGAGAALGAAGVTAVDLILGSVAARTTFTASGAKRLVFAEDHRLVPLARLTRDEGRPARPLSSAPLDAWAS